MAYFFGDGFDLYTALTDCGTYWDAAFGGTASLALSASGRFAGSRSIGPSGSTNTAVPYITKTSSVNDAVHHIALAFQQTSTLTASVSFWITLYDGAKAQCSLVFSGDGSILLRSGAATGTTLATYSGAFPATSTWYQFEIEIVVNSTTGSISVRKNGNTSNDFTLGSLNTRSSANNYANKIGLGYGAASTQIIDDFLWRSDAASVPWVGDIRCFTRMPAADSAVAWTRSGSVVPVTPFVQTTVATSSTSQARYQAFTPWCSGSVGSVIISLGAANAGNMKCTIFASSGSAPTSILGSATPLSGLSAGNNTFTFGTPVSVTLGTQYWVGFMTDTAATNSWNTTTANVALVQTSAVYATFPTASPATSVAAALIFTANVTPSGTTTNYGFVSEPQQDAAASYVYSSTASQSDLYTVQPISTTPASTIAVVTRGYVQKSDAGTRAAAVQISSGGTAYQATPLALPAGSWAWNWRTDLVDPATSAAWTATAVNNCAVGVIVTT